MLQRLIGVSIGALVTFLILWFSDVTSQVDPMPWYLAAAVIGAVSSFFWPVLAAFWLRGRARDRREDSIQREVERQIGEQKK